MRFARRQLRHAPAALALAAMALFAPAATAPAAAAEALPPQGVYEACGPAESGQACLDRLAHIRSGGFTLVLNYRQWWATEADLRRYAAEADRLGMKIIWPLDSEAWRTGADLRARYPELAATCACSDRAGFTRYVVGLVKDLPATWGYYVGDEVPEAQHAQAKALAAEIKALDPAHPTMVVSLETMNAPAATLAPFADSVDVLAGDFYPIGSEEVDTLAPIARAVGDLAAAHGKPAGMVLQAFSWEMYPGKEGVVPRWPTRDEMQRMRDIALEHARPGLILWYSYFDIAQSSEPERRWADLVAGAFAPLPGRPDPDAPDPPGHEARPAKTVLRVPARVHGSAAQRRALRRCAGRVVCRGAVRKRALGRAAVTWKLAAGERAELTAYRIAHGRTRKLRTISVSAPEGSVTLERLVGARQLRQPGRYLVTLRANGSAQQSRARFRVVR